MGSSAEHSLMPERAFVLGLDGVPWDLLKQWTDEGKLPNFERVREEGAAGPCQSTTPATTPVAWPSIATGRSADSHGVYGFHGLSGDYTHEMNTSADVEGASLWNVLSPAVVGNVPMTYPASEIDGSMVSGMLASEINEQFTYPSDLAEEIEEEIEDYQISLPWREFADDDEALPPALNQLVEGRRELLQLLMDRHDDWRLFFFVFTAPDRLQHLKWDEEVLLDHYQELDDVLGDVIEYIESMDANLFIVSDHGFGPMERSVNVNRLLEQEGYLTRDENSGVRGVLDRVGVNREALTNTLAKVGLDEDTLVALLPRAMVDSVAEKVPGDHALYDVDFEQTTAFMHFHGAVYVNDSERFEDGIVPPSERAEVRTELEEVLKAVEDPQTGERMLKVSNGGELFPEDNEAPDLIVKGQEGYLTNNALHEELIEPANMAAGHHPEGVLLAWGPSIEAGAEPEGATVLDFLPTVLKSVGKPIPSAADGRVLTEMFQEGSAAATEPVDVAAYDEAGSEVGSVDDDFDEVEDRLKGLGYI